MASSRSNDYFPELTGVRAVAAYSVFNYHFNLFPRAWFGETLYRFSHEMYLGVNVFYVLSGFLIYYRYGQALSSPSRAFLVEYGRNRFARIYPVYYLVLALTFLWFGLPDLRTTLATCTLTQAFFPDLVHAGIPQAWTLTIEETFYFTAPLLFLLVRRLTVPVVCALLVAVAFGLSSMPLAANPYQGQIGHLLGRTLLGAMPCFGCGILLAQRIQRQPQSVGSNRPPVFTYAALAACLLFMLVLSQLGKAAESQLTTGELGRGRDSEHAWFLLFVLFPALVALLFFGLLTERSLVKRLLASRPFVLLGGASYSFYLIHLGVVQRWIFDYVSDNHFMLFLVLNVVAVALFEFFEKPVARWIKRHGSHVVPAAEPTPSVRWLHTRAAAYLLLAAALVAINGVPVLVHRQGKNEAEALLVSEDGLYESVQAVICLAGAALFLFAAFESSRDKTRAQRLGPLLLAVMLLLMLGEELSWGQRIFGFGTPSWLAAINHQAEFSLHNIDLFQPGDVGNRLQNVWLLAMLLYVGVLPLLARASQAANRLVDRIGLPLASLPLCLLFLATLALHAYASGNSEVLELAVDVLLLALGIEAVVARAPHRSDAARRAALFACVPASLLAGLLWFQAGRAELPTVVSGRLTDEARLQFARGDREAAICSLHQAIELWPQNPQAHFDLANILIAQGDKDAAVEHLEEVTRREPRRAEAYVQLATIAAEKKQYRRAVDLLERALRIVPAEPRIASNLALILAACDDDQLRNGPRAVELAKRACEALDYREPLALDICAAAYAEVGRFDDAASLAQRAMQLAEQKGDAALKSRIGNHRRLYVSKKPYRLGT